MRTKLLISVFLLPLIAGPAMADARAKPGEFDVTDLRGGDDRLHIGGSNDSQDVDASRAHITFVTRPGNYPIWIDSIRQGETGPDGRKLTTLPGVHEFVVEFPDGNKWTRKLNIAGSHPACTIILTYMKDASAKISEDVVDCAPTTSAALTAASTERPGSAETKLAASSPVELAGTRCTRFTRQKKCPVWLIRLFVGCKK